MYSVEGVIAALVLLTYFSITVQPVQKNEWTLNSFKQSGMEYLEAVERANLSSVAAKNSAVFSDMANQIFDSSDIFVAAEGLPYEYIRIGVAVNHSDDTIIEFDEDDMDDNATCISGGWDTEFGCIEEDVFGKDIYLADYDVNGEFDGVFIFDSIYVDEDENGVYTDDSEGPFFTNDYVTINGNLYYVGYIDNSTSTKKVALWDTAPILKFSEAIPQTDINGRSTSLLFYGADLSRDISQFDVLAISGPLDIAPYSSKLKDFLHKGKGIVEISNITAANYNAGQEDIFGIASVGYDVIGNSNEVHVASPQTASGIELIGLDAYFSGISMRSNMSLDPSLYDMSGLPNPSLVKVGWLNVSGNGISIAVALGLADYDKLYVDFDNDYNFSESPDNNPYFAGEPFTLSSGKYIVKKISISGSYADIRPAPNATLVNFFNPMRLDSNNASWTAAEQENTYNSSSSYAGASFTIAMQPVPMLGDNETLMAGSHTYGIITPSDGYIQGSPYNISLTNVSALSFLNIDLNHDLRYDGFGEGPFANGEYVAIGPESYKIRIWNDSSVMFVFSSRKKVPASVASEKYSGRTVWMPDITSGGHDSWSYILSSIIWASPKHGEYSKLEKYGNLLVIKKASFLAGDMYQPYVLEMYRGYGK